MARDFTDIASLGSAAAAISAQPCTIAFWMTPVTSTSNGMAIGFSDGTNNNRLFFQRLTNADPVAARAVTSAGGSASGKATTGSNVTIGQWGHWCGLFPSVASRTIFFNGTDKQTDSTGLGAMAALTTFYVAAAGTGAASSQRAIFAEIGVWNTVLSDADVALLGTSKYAPSLVQPANLVAYWKLDGSGSTELDSAGSNNMTITGTVPAASHPPGILYAIPTAVSTTNNPPPQTTGGWRAPEGKSRILRSDWDEIDRLGARARKLEREAQAAEAKAFKARTARAINAAAAEMEAVAEKQQALRVELARKIEQAAAQDEEEALIAILFHV